MIRQKSFANNKPTLFLVPTPIGNLKEISLRQKEVLEQVDIIACEDTRNSGQLLKYLSIHKRLISYQNFNEEEAAKGILSLLESGQNIALISDAGYPLISDPGQKLVPLVSEAGYNVVPVSGSSAALNALVASGLIVQPFLFVGFLAKQSGQRQKQLHVLKSYTMTLILYEAPHRIQSCLQDCLEILGDRKCTLARELTKLHEEFIRGTMSEILSVCHELKGEMVLIIEGNKDQKKISDTELRKKIQEFLAKGYRIKEASKLIADEYHLAKNKIYELYLETLSKD